jgi:hypothetical protein
VHVPEEPTPAPDPRLEDRVVQLLQENSGAIAFNGLRRSLRAHPESLTRALRRLERYGVVERAPAGYRLSGGAGPASGPAGLLRGPEVRWEPVAEVALAPAVEPESLLGHLAGRWAGSLRWVGVYDRPGDPLLVWSRRDGPGNVLLSVRPSRLRVYAETPVSGPSPPAEELNAAGRELLAFALERIRFAGADHGRPGVTTFEAGPVARSPGPN